MYKLYIVGPNKRPAVVSEDVSGPQPKSPRTTEPESSRSTGHNPTVVELMEQLQAMRNEIEELVSIYTVTFIQYIRLILNVKYYRKASLIVNGRK